MPTTYATYDARTQAHAYYAQAYPDGNHLANLHMDQQQATANGIHIWTPALVLIAWEQAPGHLWIELATGYIRHLPHLLKHPHHYHTITYIRHGRTVTHPAAQLARRLN